MYNISKQYSTFQEMDGPLKFKEWLNIDETTKLIKETEGKY